MRGSRYGKYGELKRHERLKASRDAKRKLDRNSLKPKNKSGSMNQDPSLKIFFWNETAKRKEITCKCVNTMEFYGVDGNSGEKYYCRTCCEKKVVR
jgi:hypothetical protein